MPKKIPLVELIRRAENVHGKGRYDYSLINEENYKDTHSNVNIKCNVCEDVFPQSFHAHIGQKTGCPNCAKNKKDTIDSFIEKAKKVHGDKYDYSKVVYINNRTNVLIGCKTCGDIFPQTPNRHLQGQGCPECAKNKKYTTESFIEKARKVHGDKYDYSKVKYIGSKIDVIIKCSDCNTIFSQTPNGHLQGQGCPECAKKKRGLSQTLDTETFIKRGRELYGNKYDYSKVDYVNNRTDVLIKCNDCDYEFEVTPNAHLNNHQGCPVCTKGRCMNTEIFIRKAKILYGDKYDYSKVEYINVGTNVIIICNSCHRDFPQTPRNHLQLHGCPYCKSSNGEKEISSFLESKNINFISQYRFNDCRDRIPLPFDFYLPNHNVCIEYDGRQHFEEIDVWGGKKGLTYTQKHDSIKTNYCKQNNIPLLRIKYDEDIETRLNQFLYNKCKIEPQSIFDL